MRLCLVQLNNFIKLRYIHHFSVRTVKMWYLMKFPVIFMVQLLYLCSSCDGRQAWSLSKTLRFPAIILQSIITQKDREFMQRALQLAGKAKRKTSPNPCVGCVIVSENGTIIGEGWHERAGESHAEVKALQDMRQRGRSTAENATAYVTLEPCNHYGRTPPCTLALIR
jgi:deoxycytidylate deaminase